MQSQPIIAEYIQCDLLGSTTPVQPDDDLLAYSSIDSLAVMNLVAFLEERFAIEVPPDAVTIENFRTVAAISALVERRQG